MDSNSFYDIDMKEILLINMHLIIFEKSNVMIIWSE